MESTTAVESKDASSADITLEDSARPELTTWMRKPLYDYNTIFSASEDFLNINVDVLLADVVGKHYVRRLTNRTSTREVTTQSLSETQVEEKIGKIIFRVLSEMRNLTQKSFFLLPKFRKFRFRLARLRMTSLPTSWTSLVLRACRKLFLHHIIYRIYTSAWHLYNSQSKPNSK